MLKLQLCVFDMAGTTVDEDNVVYKTLQAAINAQGIAVSLDEVLEHGAGKEKHQAILDILRAESNHSDIETVAQDAFADFQRKLDDAYRTLAVKPIAGVSETIQQLRARGIKVVLNTGYSREVAEALLQKMAWQVGRDIDGLVTASDVTKGRPHPDMIEQAMALVDVNDAVQVLKAGDSAIDIHEGKNAQCGVTVGVLSGAQTRRQLELAQPDYILNSLADLPEALGL